MTKPNAFEQFIETLDMSGVWDSRQENIARLFDEIKEQYPPIHFNCRSVLYYIQKPKTDGE